MRIILKLKIIYVLASICCLSIFLNQACANELELLFEDDLYVCGTSTENTIISVNDTLYFSARDPDSGHGCELWTSDGTVSGTYMVKDIRPGAYDSHIRDLTKIGSIIYFSADDGTRGRELWKSDGTEAGTVIVEDIYPGAAGEIHDLIAVGNTLFFRTFHSLYQNPLYMSDGTAAGTTLVKEVFLQRSSANNTFASFNGEYFFTASSHDGYGMELWKSDGTAAGTFMVKDIYPGSALGVPRDGDPRHLTVVGDKLFFIAYSAVGYELWVSDGTTSGTSMVEDIYSGSFSSDIEQMTAVDDILYFYAFEDTDGADLWKSDGSSSGTAKVKEFNSGVHMHYDLRHLTAVGDKLFFTYGRDIIGDYGTELWVSDGTDSGTVMVKDIYPGDSSSRPEQLTEFSNELFFSADNGSDSNSDELWKSDGTNMGTVMQTNTEEADFTKIFAAGNNLFFWRNSSNGLGNDHQLWVFRQTDNPEA